MDDRPVPVQLGEGERFVPLSDAVAMLGAPSVAALRGRIHRSSNPLRDGFQKRGGRWYVLVRDPDQTTNGDTDEA